MIRSLKVTALLSLVAATGLVAPPASAAVKKTGAEALLESMGPAAPTGRTEVKLKKVRPATAPVPEVLEEAVSFDTSNPFFSSFFAAKQGANSKLSFDSRAWANRVLKGEWKAAAHLWSSLNESFPESFRLAAQAAYAQSLLKLDLPNAFVAEYLELAAQDGVNKCATCNELTKSIGSLDGWVREKLPLLSERQKQWLRQQPLNEEFIKTNPFLVTLRAYSMLRTGRKALSVLEALPEGHAFAVPLAETVSLDMIRSGEVPAAAKILRTYLEPALAEAKNPEKLALHYLNVARLLFQSGEMDGAQSFYEKIPAGSQYYLDAREELSWVLLRKGDVVLVRGQLQSLSSKIYSGRFQPEVPVVRSVSNLKLCYYDKVQADLEDFNKTYAGWAKKIDEALRQTETPRPDADDYTQLAETRLKLLENERARVQELGQESIKAVLPAIGIQKHWVELDRQLLKAVESAKQDRSIEYKRQWKAQQLALTEAIRKMRFVRIEFLSQIRRLALQSDMKSNQTAAAGSQDDSSPKEKIAPTAGDQVFPFDGVIWPDEFFTLRSAAANRCRALGDLK